MIYDRLENLAQYRGISKWMDMAIDAVRDMDLYAMDIGRYTIAGEDVYCMIQAPVLKAAIDTKWEAHERYIDIQIGLTDGEAIGYAPLAKVDGWQPYSVQKDAKLSASTAMGTRLPLSAGMFAVFFPQDAHRPCESVGGAAQGRKAVVKVRVGLG